MAETTRRLTKYEGPRPRRRWAVVYPIRLAANPAPVVTFAAAYEVERCRRSDGRRCYRYGDGLIVSDGKRGHQFRAADMMAAARFLSARGFLCLLRVPDAGLFRLDDRGRPRRVMSEWEVETLNTRGDPDLELRPLVEAFRRVEDMPPALTAWPADAEARRAAAGRFVAYLRRWMGWERLRFHRDCREGARLGVQLEHLARLRMETIDRLARVVGFLNRRYSLGLAFPCRIHELAPLPAAADW